MAKEKLNVTCKWYFLKTYLKDCIYQEFRFLLQFYCQLYHRIVFLRWYLFYKATLFIMYLIY